MKPLFLFLAVLAAPLQCSNRPSAIDIGPTDKYHVESFGTNDRRVQIVEVDSCEYIVYLQVGPHGQGAGICHKANCRFCAERIKKRRSDETTDN